MNTCRKVRSAFTLVELLVVIGIIALLISILLPALGKARQQANLLVCKSGMRTIGQLMQVYAAENKGYFPMAASQTWYTTYADTLTLQMTKRYATTPFPGQPTGAERFEPAQDAAIFKDVDMPDITWYDHATSYIGNIRVMGGENIWEPFSGATDGWRQRQIATIRRASEVMLLWCAAVDIGTGTNYGVHYAFPNALDNYQMYGGHALAFPIPFDSAAFTGPDYANAIALGAPLSTAANASSQNAGSVTQSYLHAANTDYTNSGTYNGPGGFDTNNMRFRHMNNTTANFLFVDGHVEDRKLGAVYAKDICCNARKL